MKITRHSMGMPVVINCPDATVTPQDIEPLFSFFNEIDERYSPYKSTSEVAAINRGSQKNARYSRELAAIVAIAQSTKKQTHGYFDVWHNNTFDPSGIVKGWAIQKAAGMLSKITDNFYIEIAGDIQVSGMADTAEPWRIGIRNPFNRHENISVVSLDNSAIATSGTAIRGNHIYNPIGRGVIDSNIVSLSVIGSRIIDADQYATAAFAMGKAGIAFIESLKGFEGYMVDAHKMATMTSGWAVYEVVS